MVPIPAEWILEDEEEFASECLRQNPSHRARRIFLFSRGEGRTLLTRIAAYRPAIA
jgi:hypothetical protein